MVNETVDTKISQNRGRVGIDSIVMVDLFRRPNGNHYMIVKLRSVMRPELISYYSADMDKYTNQLDFLKEVGIAGGALATRQNELYLDHHDPAECVKVAVEIASDIMHNDL